jgi:NTE family protein
MKRGIRMRAKVGLALGSGGLRGLAHIGVLKVLMRENIPIDMVAGCSIGSLIGALFCAGMDPETMCKLGRHLNRSYWLDFVVPKMGLVGGDKLLETVRLLTKRLSFEQLKIPLAVVATDINEGREVVFESGDIASAVRASISVPGIFVPYQIDNKVLVDGAVLNPTPIDIARQMGADVVIAVDIVHSNSVCSLNNMFDVILQSIDIMERELFRHRQHHCDLVIRPELSHIPPSDFEAMDECVAAGERATEAVLLQIKKLLDGDASECKAVCEENPDHLQASDR